MDQKARRDGREARGSEEKEERIEKETKRYFEEKEVLRDPPFIRISRSDPAVNAWRWYSHNLQFCWIFPICDASLTCLGVTILFKKIRGNLKNFAIQLGDQGGRGEECSKAAQSPPSNLCVCDVASVTSSPQDMTSWSSSIKIWISQSYRMHY